MGSAVVIHERDRLMVVEHDGGIEGFDTHLSYVPERRIVVVVLSNVNGPAPDRMADPLLDVVLGRPIVFAAGQ